MVRKIILVLNLMLLIQILWANEPLVSKEPQCIQDIDESMQQTNESLGNLYVFVSFSMPKQSLQLWALQARKAGGILILRGLKNNSFKETLTYAKSVFGEENINNFVIDPTAFDRFNVQTIPAVLVTDKPILACNKSTCEVPSHDLIYGDIGLTAALQKLSENGDLAKVSSKYLKKLETT